MMHFILRFLILAAAIFLISLVVPGMRLRTFKTALSVAGVYSLLNWVLFKVLWFITFPLIFLKYVTLGLFGIVINAVLLMITDKFLDDFQLSGFGSAVLAAAGISLVNLVLTLIFM